MGKSGWIGSSERTYLNASRVMVRQRTIPLHADMSKFSTTNSHLLGMLAGEALCVHDEPFLLKMKHAVSQGLDVGAWAPASGATGEDAW
jgi:hypothetical protein